MSFLLVPCFSAPLPILVLRGKVLYDHCVCSAEFEGILVKDLAEKALAPEVSEASKVVPGKGSRFDPVEDSRPYLAKVVLETVAKTIRTLGMIVESARPSLRHFMLGG